MSASNNKKKRAAPAQTPISITQPNIIHSLLDSYDFLASNEYSEKTIGLQAFLLRKGVGDINFSDIIDDSERRNRQGQTASCVTILEDKRTSLPEIEASIEKCMMLTRLISYIKEHETQFTGLLSDVRLEMQYNMTDAQVDKTSPNFQKRVNDFYARKLAQEKRRLFFFNHHELGEPANLVYLQNRTTEQLNYLLTRKTDSKSNQIQQEFDTIFKTSFLIVTQPHSGVNPITIYERRRPGEYTAKISVTIISLLNDFIEQHPNLIELVDIEPSLHPISPHYKLAEPQTISWKPCQIQTELAGRSRTFLCAELTSITIEQSSKTDTRVRFAQLLHSLKFAIKIHFHSTEIKSPIFEYALDSLQFGIGAHNNQIPQLLTRVLLEDIRYFTKSPYNDVKTIHDFITRYFIHRAGVYPKEYVKAYLEQELFKASNQRSNFKASEDIYLDFLVNFVFQVEFMAKHPILSMFHDDGLFLSICNSERAAEAIVQSSETGWPVIELRFNSIRIDYSAISAQQGSNRTIRLQPCAVRVDIYNGRTNKLQNRTFDSSVLASDISKFVSSTESPSASRIRILSNFDDPSNEKQYLSFTDFSRYHHPRLQQICKSDDKYKPVTDLVENVTDGGFDEELLDSLNLTPTILPSPYSIEPFSVTQNSQLDFDQNSDSNSMHEYMTIPYDNNNTNYASPTPTNFTSPPTPQQQQQSVPLQNNQEAVLQQIIQNNPNLVQQLLRQYQSNNFNNPTSIEAQAQTQIQYQMPSPYSTQIQMTSPQQRPQIQIVQQPIYHQPQMYSQPQPQMQFAPSPQQHHQHYQQQQTTTMFVPQQVMFQQRGQTQPIIHYVPNNSYQPFQPQFVQQTQQMPIYQNQPQDNQPINVNMNMNMSQQQQQQQQPISIDPTTSNNIDLEQLLAGISASSSSSTTTT